MPWQAVVCNGHADRWEGASTSSVSRICLEAAAAASANVTSSALRRLRSSETNRVTELTSDAAVE